MKHINNAFIKGWFQLKGIDQPKVKEEIMTLFNITSRNAFYERRRGLYKLTYDEKIGIENIFSKYGVKQSEIWS